MFQFFNSLALCLDLILPFIVLKHVLELCSVVVYLFLYKKILRKISEVYIFLSFCLYFSACCLQEFFYL